MLVGKKMGVFSSSFLGPPCDEWRLMDESDNAAVITNGIFWNEVISVFCLCSCFKFFSDGNTIAIFAKRKKGVDRFFYFAIEIDPNAFFVWSFKEGKGLIS